MMFNSPRNTVDFAKSRVNFRVTKNYFDDNVSVNILLYTESDRVQLLRYTHLLDWLTLAVRYASRKVCVSMMLFSFSGFLSGCTAFSITVFS